MTLRSRLGPSDQSSNRNTPDSEYGLSPRDVFLQQAACYTADHGSVASENILLGLENILLDSKNGKYLMATFP